MESPGPKGIIRKPCRDFRGVIALTRGMFVHLTRAFCGILCVSTYLHAQGEASRLTRFPELDGFPVSFEEDVFPSSGMNVGDIDGDGDLEICFGTRRGALFAYHHTGAVVEGWPVGMEGGWLEATPALVDIDNDGDLEVFVTNGTYLHAFHHDGEPLEGWPVALDHSVHSDATPSIGDLDGDGDYEIVHGAAEYPCLIFAWHHDGTPVDGWPVYIPPGYLNHCDCSAAPALADLEGNGKLEVVVVTRGGQVYVINNDGSDFEGWPVDGIQGMHNYNSPVIGDIDNDGEVDIVVVADYTVFAWDINGNDKPGWPWQEGFSSGVILADLVSDEALEVIANTSNSIYVLDGPTGEVLPGWPQPVGMSVSIAGTVITNDIDSDGEKEILVECWGQHSGVRSTGYVLAYNADGSTVEGFPIVLDSETASLPPLIVDFDLDGDLDICGLTGTYFHAWDLPSYFEADQGDWRMLNHDPFHTNDFGLLLPTEHPIDVGLKPDTVTVHRGESVDLIASFTNRNVIYQPFTTAIFLRMPNGEPFPANPLLGPLSLRLKLLSGVMTEKSLDVPINAPLGDYRLLLPAWTSVYNIMDVDSTIVHVID